MGVSQVGDHAHCEWNGSQQPEVTAYVQKFLVGGGTADTHVLKTDAATYCPTSGTCTAYGFDQARWVDWAVPSLQ
jgi:(4-O-methyl)-D-glucuronate---lignin esterase